MATGPQFEPPTSGVEHRESHGGADHVITKASHSQYGPVYLKVQWGAWPQCKARC